MAERGRPTKYKPAYCNEVITTMATGLSLTAFAGEIGVARSTINEWIDNQPDFSEAVRVAKAKRTLALEKGMLSADSGPAVTARMFALKNADPDEWRDKTVQDLNVMVDISDELAQRRQQAASGREA